MATPTFYHEALDINDERITLCAAESLHASKSRRLRVGDKVRLINGRGLVADGVFESGESRQVCIQIADIQQHSKPRTMIVATALPKGDRQRTMIDMLTQLGVTSIIPVQCEYSVTRFKTSLLEKWQRIAVEACKQSQNPWLPEFNDVVNVTDLLDSMLTTKPNITVVYTDGQGESLMDVEIAKDGVLCLVGPEGGFSEKELVLFVEAKIQAIKLGENILRTELAGVSIAAQLALSPPVIETKAIER